MRHLTPPLPQRHGLDPARMWLPAEGTWPTIRAYLAERIPQVNADVIDRMFTEQRIANLEGPLRLDAPFRPASWVWFHRELPIETPVPFELSIVYRDERIVIADKPHFLATIPRGKHIMETALIRLRQQLDLPELSAAHRLDRVTAGLVLFVIQRKDRGAYQTLFRDRLVHKEYEAIAPINVQLCLPCEVQSRIVKERGTMTAYELPGEPNSHTRVELIEQRDGLGRYRLLPTTGRTHQLRLHMSGLGVPILGDDFYPVFTETALDDFRQPLQLLAKMLAFTDPITGKMQKFYSQRTLAAWHDYHNWQSNPIPINSDPANNV